MKNSNMKTYTAVVKIGDGSKELGLYRTTVKVEALNETSARKKALDMALSSTDVTVGLSEGQDIGVNEVYRKIFGDNPEPW